MSNGITYAQNGSRLYTGAIIVVGALLLTTMAATLAYHKFHSSSNSSTDLSTRIFSPSQLERETSSE